MSAKRVQIQGVHHITIVGSTKKSSVDFWQGILGMPFIFEQPNLGNPKESHLYFDPGDGRLLTVFTDETRTMPAALRRAKSVQSIIWRSTSRARHSSKRPRD